MRILSGFAAAVLAGAVASAGDPSIVFNFPISVDQAVPAPTLPIGEPEPSGNGMVTYNPASNLIEWTIEYQGLTGQIVSPGAHFHGPAVVGNTAGIQVFLTDGDPPEPASGTLMGSATISEMQETDLLDGLWYVNIHTQQNPAGEIRGQVVPEPGCLLALSLAGLALIRRR